MKAESLIGNFIRNSRKERNLSQAQLAEYADVSYTFVNRVENGDLGVTVSVVNKVLMVFGYEIGPVPIIANNSTEETA